MAFQLTDAPDSVCSYACSNREAAGDVRVCRGKTPERVKILYTGAPFTPINENVPALIALHTAGNSPYYQGTKFILGAPSIYPPSLPNPSAATIDRLSAFYDPSAVADTSLPMMRPVGVRDLPNFFPGTLSLKDYLRGLGGDVLVGQLSKETLVGDAGNDEFYSGSSKDSLADEAGEGVVTVTDTDFDQVLVVRYLAYLLPPNIEGGQFQGNEDISIDGKCLSNDISGNIGRNDLDGGSGSDWLDGAGGSNLLTCNTPNRMAMQENSESYFLGDSPLSTVFPRSGLSRDTNGTRQLEGVDELVAILQKTGAISVTTANTISTALLTS